jgi:hypothetical protein
MEGGLEPALGFSQAVWSKAEASRRLKPALQSYNVGVHNDRHLRVYFKLEEDADFRH